MESNRTQIYLLNKKKSGAEAWQCNKRRAPATDDKGGGGGHGNRTKENTFKQH